MSAKPSSSPPPRLSAVVALALSAVGCPGNRDTTRWSEVLPPLAVDYSGCAEIWAGPVCELPENGELRLWIDGTEDAELVVTAGDARLPARRAAVQGGAQLRVNVPQDAPGLTVFSRRKESEASFRLALVPSNPVPSLVKAEALRQNGKFDEASHHVAAVLDDRDVRVRARAKGKAARIAFARGNVDQAVELYEDALTLDREAGSILGEVLDRVAFGYLLVHTKRDFTKAERVLTPLADLGPEGGARAPYYLGQLALKTGDIRRALALFRDAERRSERLGNEVLTVDAQTEQLIALHRIGRKAPELRDALVREASHPRTSTCKRAEIFTNLGYLATPIERDDTRGESNEAAIAWLDAAAKLYDVQCPKPLKRANSLSILALAELEGGAIASAAEHLRAARAMEARFDAYLEARLLEIEAQIALAEGRLGAALLAFDREAKSAADGQVADAELRATIGRARVLDRLGRASDALAAYERSEVQLDALSRSVALGEDRDSFVAGGNKSVARHHVGFLVERHAIAEAAEVARRSRSRVIASMTRSAQIERIEPRRRDEWYERQEAYQSARDALETSVRDDWKRSAEELETLKYTRASQRDKVSAARDALLAFLDEATPKGASRLSSEALAQPGEGEVFLVYHPVPRGWVGIALSPDFGAIAKALPELDPKAEPHELAVQILDPFRERIDGARRIRFLAYGALDQRDLHALPLMPAGRPLLEIAPVEYGVDLPGRGTKPHGPARLGALVVSNPTGNLPRAHQEGQVATTVLRHTLSRRVELLEGSAATTRSIQASLQDPEIDFLHFAGHGHAPKGDEESTLSLAGGGSISASDILMLPRCPRVVVLSGCETARPSRAAVAEGLGLAQAFVVAGAGTAVAAIQPVDDRTAGRIMARFYQALGAGDPTDAATALRAAELDELGSPGAAASPEWAHFRVLVP